MVDWALKTSHPSFHFCVGLFWQTSTNVSCSLGSVVGAVSASTPRVLSAVPALVVWPSTAPVASVSVSLFFLLCSLFLSLSVSLTFFSSHFIIILLRVLLVSGEGVYPVWVYCLLFLYVKKHNSTVVEKRTTKGYSYSFRIACDMTAGSQLESGS